MQEKLFKRKIYIEMAYPNISLNIWRGSFLKNSVQLYVLYIARIYSIVVLRGHTYMELYSKVISGFREEEYQTVCRLTRVLILGLSLMSRGFE